MFTSSFLNLSVFAIHVDTWGFKTKIGTDRFFANVSVCGPKTGNKSGEQASALTKLFVFLCEERKDYFDYVYMPMFPFCFHSAL